MLYKHVRDKAGVTNKSGLDLKYKFKSLMTPDAPLTLSVG